jgi:hypothetical protein
MLKKIAKLYRPGVAHASGITLQYDYRLHEVTVVCMMIWVGM